mmetsp:Transcript_26131/g.58561  ORF Transcript_26131/g.58561 Transcript_26131/m.58561 type:complete len:228 (-) Transcript_26131:482-1165(-)
MPPGCTSKQKKEFFPFCRFRSPSPKKAAPPRRFPFAEMATKNSASSPAPEIPWRVSWTMPPSEVGFSRAHLASSFRRSRGPMTWSITQSSRRGANQTETLAAASAASFGVPFPPPSLFDFWLRGSHETTFMSHKAVSGTVASRPSTGRPPPRRTTLSSASAGAPGSTHHRAMPCTFTESPAPPLVASTTHSPTTARLCTRITVVEAPLPPASGRSKLSTPTSHHAPN